MSDLTPDQQTWLAPLVAHRWPGSQVRFPAFTRRLSTPYACLTSAHLHVILAPLLNHTLRLNTPVDKVTATNVTLTDGTILTAPLVIDARGPAPDVTRHFAFAWQVFLGQELELTAPHGLTEPVIMDATVEQPEAYRFVYLLPLSPTRVLVEDTCYQNGPDLDHLTLRQRIATYIQAQGWQVAQVVREEASRLPITLAGHPAAAWPASDPLPRIGLRAAAFQPTTGYSLPDAVRTADHIATLLHNPAQRHSAAMAHALRTRASRQWRGQGFYRLLNRMLFLAAEPHARVPVFARFYRLPEATIERFYAGNLTIFDRARLLIGKPPVSIIRALRSLPACAAWRQQPFASGHVAMAQNPTPETTPATESPPA